MPSLDINLKITNQFQTVMSLTSAFSTGLGIAFEESLTGVFERLKIQAKDIFSDVKIGTGLNNAQETDADMHEAMVESMEETNTNYNELTMYELGQMIIEKENQLKNHAEFVKNISDGNYVYELKNHQKTTLSYERELRQMKAARKGFEGDITEDAERSSKDRKRIWDKEIAGFSVKNIAKAYAGYEVGRAVFRDMMETEAGLSTALARAGESMDWVNKKTKEHREEISKVKGQLLGVPFEKVNTFYNSIVKAAPALSTVMAGDITVTLSKLSKAGVDLSAMGGESLNNFIRAAGKSKDAAENMKIFAGSLTMLDMESQAQALEALTEGVGNYGDAWAKNAGPQAVGWMRSMTQHMGMTGQAAGDLVGKMLKMQLGEGEEGQGIANILGMGGTTIDEINKMVESGNIGKGLETFVKVVQTQKEMILDNKAYVSQMTKLFGVESKEQLIKILNSGKEGIAMAEKIAAQAAVRNRLNDAYLQSSKNLETALLTLKQSFVWAFEEIFIKSGIFTTISSIMQTIAGSPMLKGLAVGAVSIGGVVMLLTKAYSLWAGGLKGAFFERGTMLNPMVVTMMGAGALGAGGDALGKAGGALGYLGRLSTLSKATGMLSLLTGGAGFGAAATSLGAVGAAGYAGYKGGQAIVNASPIVGTFWGDLLADMIYGKDDEPDKQMEEQNNILKNIQTALELSREDTKDANLRKGAENLRKGYTQIDVPGERVASNEG